MKQHGKNTSSDELRPEYDVAALLENGVQGKYARQYREGTNLVLLEPEIHKQFADDKAVNDALRLVLELRKIGGRRRGGRG